MSSSAAVPAAISRPSAPRSWACAWPASTTGATNAASLRPAEPAPTSAAFRPRRCCNRPSTTSRRCTVWPSTGSSMCGRAMDLARMIERKNVVVRQNNEGILYLFKKNKVSFFHGRGSFQARFDAGWELALSADPGVLRARNVVVATGSSPPCACRAYRSTNSSSCPTRARSTMKAVPKSLGDHRRRRDRSGDRIGVAAPGRRSHRARGAARVPRRGR